VFHLLFLSLFYVLRKNNNWNSSAHPHYPGEVNARQGGSQFIMAVSKLISRFVSPREPGPVLVQIGSPLSGGVVAVWPLQVEERGRKYGE